MFEHPMITQINRFGYPKEIFNLENMVRQPEHAGIDYYDTEILEGDSIVIDKENFEELILRENLPRYLVERCYFLRRDDIYVDTERGEIIKEDELEKYLHEEHGFEFASAS